jgi:hypothetical protein
MNSEIKTINRKDSDLNYYRINVNFEVVKCMRPNVLGNPNVLKSEDARDENIAQFKQYLWKKMQSDNPVSRELTRLATCEKVVVLVCCCKPKACHTDVIKAAIEWMRKNK